MITPPPPRATNIVLRAGDVVFTADEVQRLNELINDWEQASLSSRGVHHVRLAANDIAVELRELLQQAGARGTGS